MQKKIVAIMGVICTVLIIWSFSSWKQAKMMELDFSKKKASLIKETLDLKDKIASLEQIINQKTTELNIFEESTRSLKEELVKFKLDNESLKSEYNRLNSDYAAAKKKSEALEEEIRALTSRVAELKESAPVQLGKPVSLAPIVVSGRKTAQPELTIEKEKIGQVVSLDKKNSLVIIDLGRKDKVEAGDVCAFFKNDTKIASGQVLNVRYDMAAVFLNEAEYKSAFNDIQEGDKVSVGEKG